MPGEVLPLVETLRRWPRSTGCSRPSASSPGDVAHELNTPLAAIKLQVQLAQQAHASGQTVALDDLEAGIERAVHLVAQLLQMARLEPDARPLEPQPVELEALARERVLAFWPRPNRRTSTSDSEIRQPAHGSGRPAASCAC